MTEPDRLPVAELIQGSITRPKIRPAYQLGLILVAIAMVLLPLIYIALIFAVAYALYLYAAGAPAWFRSLGAWGLLALAPVVVGVVLLFFMIKPLFARRGPGLKPLTLDPSRQKPVFDFVGQLCDVVGVPKPSCINVDLDVNASAGFDRGWGFLSRRRATTAACRST